MSNKKIGSTITALALCPLGLALALGARAEAAPVAAQGQIDEANTIASTVVQRPIGEAVALGSTSEAGAAVNLTKELLCVFYSVKFTFLGSEAAAAQSGGQGLTEDTVAVNGSPYDAFTG